MKAQPSIPLADKLAEKLALRGRLTISQIEAMAVPPGSALTDYRRRQARKVIAELAGKGWAVIDRKAGTVTYKGPSPVAKIRRPRLDAGPAPMPEIFLRPLSRSVDQEIDQEILARQLREIYNQTTTTAGSNTQFTNTGTTTSFTNIRYDITVDDNGQYYLRENQ